MSCPAHGLLKSAHKGGHIGNHASPLVNLLLLKLEPLRSKGEKKVTFRFDLLSVGLLQSHICSNAKSWQPSPVKRYHRSGSPIRSITTNDPDLDIDSDPALNNPVAEQGGEAKRFKELLGCLGMKGGYENLKFSKLEDEFYNARKTTSNSTFLNAEHMKSRKLHAEDIVDQGFDRNRKEGRRYKLEDSLWEKVAKVVTEAQGFLDKAGHLIEEKECVFIIDLEGMMLSILKGNDDLSFIYTTWMALTKRIGSLSCFFQKYWDQYQW